ncbi:hypothetical protein FE257_004418 [Aspergillus nanangensis]|uniref:Zn(2)-C6 fungal-type domain-containing protein n=1 Tax=Aspergillus nanangensis TaxID=2582783 RepID=A0AAD4CZX0_ASPNN|nr:hypothetical protein FE257_004418 [Aspergillus nanangensis]
MGTRASDRPASRPQSTRPATAAACEACRRLKMRCIRPKANNEAEPCDRCRRNKRPCRIPPPRPLGRKPGAVGRYRGIEKAYRKMQIELKKARTSTDATIPPALEGVDLSQSDETILELLFANGPIDDPPTTTSTSNHAASHTSTHHPDHPSFVDVTLPDLAPVAHISPRTEPTASPARWSNDQGSSPATAEPISNPLALLADASEAAQAAGTRSVSATTSPASNADLVSKDTPPGTEIGRQLLHRPGYVSLGLRLSRDTLESGLDALFRPATELCRYSDYFRAPESLPLRDVGPDLDPVDLGLVTMDEAHALFPIYFIRLHPVNGILDPMLHTPEYVRSHSALLFTWILALTAQFEHGFSSIAKRLRLHGDRLSRHVHTCGFKSVEIVQGYYISLLSATPAKSLAEERSWLYTMYAFGVAAELGLDQESRFRHQFGSATRPLNNFQLATPDTTTTATHALSHPPNPLKGDDEFYHPSSSSTSDDPSYAQRLERNRERTWFRILLWERANSAAAGRTSAFPETELTCNVDRWWLHAVADPTDKHTCAFILLRRHLASLHTDLRRQAAVSHANPHWIRDLIDTTLEPWRAAWLLPTSSVTSPPSSDPSEQLSTIFLYYVYLHNRLGTLSFALHVSINGNRDLDAIREDCFEAAVQCCEVAVRDLQTIGEPLYCMLAPTWAMISYAAVLALKLFPWLHGSRPGYEVELLALLAQVALQLEKAGTTPVDRFGIAALLGQHLLMILRTKAAGLREAVIGGVGGGVFDDAGQGQTQALALTQAQTPAYGHTHPEYSNQLATMVPETTNMYDPILSIADPFLSSTTFSVDGDLTGDGFTDLFREIFGPSFGDVF